LPGLSLIEPNEEQLMELEALQSIYGGDFEREEDFCAGFEIVIF